MPGDDPLYSIEAPRMFYNALVTLCWAQLVTCVLLLCIVFLLGIVLVRLKQFSR